MNDPLRALFARAMDLRRAHDVEGAYAAIADAAHKAPDDPLIAAAHAHIAYDSWRPSSALFDRAIALNPADLGLVRALAFAMNAEGAGRAADALLVRMLSEHPGWIDGHKALVTLRSTAGFGSRSVGSFAEACQKRPDDMALRLAWFQALATLRDWPTARAVIADAIDHFGPARGLTLASIFIASESDEASRDPKLFDRVAAIDDVGLDLCKVRFHLRNDQPEQAAAIAERRSAGAAARTFWPYLSLVWRLTNDPRSVWLGEGSAMIGVSDLKLPTGDLVSFEKTLRKLFVLRAPYPEQSVRGGVQTDRHLFFNPDPTIQRMRALILNAVQEYIDRLPPVIKGHPLLGPARAPIMFDGSWSVLLRDQGHHAAHTHNRGWLSSAFYIAVPTETSHRAGWIEFGAPPKELGLPLEPILQVQPKPGRLVLFPSTMWHGTVPSAAGDRITVAFDVAVPPSG